MTARRDLPGESFEARSAFARAAHVQIRGGNKASISAFLNDDSKGEIPRSEWLAQRDALREHGNDLIESELRARPRAYDTGPGPLA